MASTHLIDAVIVAVYLVLAFGFGVFASRLLRSGNKSEEDYFLAGRKMPGWLNGISYAVTAMNADVAPAYCGMAVVVGLSVSWFYLSRFGVALMVAALLFALKWRKLHISTGPEFFSLRFGGRGGQGVRVYTSLFSVVVNMVPWIGAGLLGVHLIFAPIFGIESKLITLAIVIPVLLIYVWISGFAGVLVTDAVQTVIILAANIMLLVMVLLHVGGPDGLAAALVDAHPEASGDILSLLPVPGHRVLGPLVVLAWLIVPTIGYGGTVTTEGQRIFASRTPREAAKVGIWGEVALFAMLLLLTLPALGALVNHPELYYATPQEREQVYGLLLDEYLPVGFLGIALAALVASVMSTIDSHLNYGAQTLLNDVYRPLMGEPDPRHAPWIGRLLMLLLVAGAIAVVYFSDSLIGIAVVLFGIYGSTLPFAWGQWWWWRVNIWSWVAAFIGGPVVYFTLGAVLQQWPWWQEQLALGESVAQGMAMLQAVMAMALTTTLWISVTLLTRPVDMDVLKTFYRQAQPMGLWGPVRAALAQETGAAEPDPPRFLISGGFAASLLGFSWVALAVLAISDLVVGRYGRAAALALGAVLLALAFKRVFNWYLQRIDNPET